MEGKTTEFRFTISASALAKPPSVQDGFCSLSEEKLMRAQGCDWIQRACILLELTHETSAKAQILFHRFYYRVSMKTQSVKNVSMASIFVASKLDEKTTVRLSDIANTFERLLLRDSLKHETKKLSAPELKKRLNDSILVPSNQEYWNAKTAIVLTESWILKALEFIFVDIETPFRYLLNYFNVLVVDPFFAQVCWSILNDSFRLDWCVRLEPYKIATACIYLTERFLGNLPETQTETIDYALPEGWWELFDTSLEEISDMSLSLLTLYEEHGDRFGLIKPQSLQTKKLKVEQK